MLTWDGSLIDGLLYIRLTVLSFDLSFFQEGASQFEKSAATLKRKYWWKNIKMIIMYVSLKFLMLILIFHFSMCAIVVLLVIIIVIWAGGNGK